ncbi:MAG: hypothetical protein CM1200mP3_13480 [Chloroflexota bacterium]|nr:MAG: hypothetical protein CM1200mP3_13480 [Chloroflexota bacterium]
MRRRTYSDYVAKVSVGGVCTGGFVCVFGLTGVIFSLVDNFWEILAFRWVNNGILITFTGIVLLLAPRSLGVPVLTSLSIGSNNRQWILFILVSPMLGFTKLCPTNFSSRDWFGGWNRDFHGEFIKHYYRDFGLLIGMGIVMTLVTLAALFFEERFRCL